MTGVASAGIARAAIAAAIELTPRSGAFKAARRFFQSAAARGTGPARTFDQVETIAGPGKRDLEQSGRDRAARSPGAV